MQHLPLRREMRGKAVVVRGSHFGMIEREEEASALELQVHLQVRRARDHGGGNAGGRE